MKTRLIRLGKIVAVLTFVVGLSLFINAMAKRPASPRSFVVTYNQTEKDTNGKAVVKAIEVRVVKATGEQKYTTYKFVSGITRTTVSTLEDIYEIKPESLEYYNSMEGWDRIDQAFRSAIVHKSHPEFVREEQVAELNTYVHRVGKPDSNSWVETFYATETGATPLKTVIHNDSGSEIMIEAINIQFREVSDEEVRLPDLPVRFDKAEKLVNEYRDMGNMSAADALVNHIESAKQKNWLKK